MGTRCRVCIKKAAKWTLLNTKIEDSSNLSFFDFLNKYISLNACESDKLPQSLCSVCARIIRTFYKFLKLAEKSDTILREALKKTIATERCNDKRELSCEEITIKSEKVEEESEDFNKEDSFHCQTSTDATGSSLYVLDIVKEESRISESTSIVAKINETDEFHSNLDHPEGNIEQPDDILSCIDGHPASIDAEYSDSEDDVPITLLKWKPFQNKDETMLISFTGTKNEYENHIKIGLGCRNHVKNISEAAADSLTGHIENNYKCKECNMVFNDKEEFRTHCRNHIYGVIRDEKNRYKCSICGNGFKYLANLHKHIRRHDDGKSFECEMCGKKFTTKYYLRDHMESHSGVIKKCNQCGKELKNSESLRIHMKRHTNPKPFKCESCGKLFGKKCNYTYHMEISETEDHFNEETHRKGHTENTCTECNMVFNDKEQFETHWRNHIHGDKHECYICGKKFARHKCLQHHLANHDEKKKYKCSICGKYFKQASLFRNHMIIHSGEKPFKCEICSKKFTTNYNLKDHIESHSGVTKKCNQCDKEFKYAKGLRRHMKWHTNPKPFKCENCGQLFSTKFIYIRHIEICKPAGSSNVETHRDGHTENTCTECDMVFNDKGEFETHCRNQVHGVIRDGEKGYKCSICGNGFKYLVNCQKHMRTHNGEKPFKCEICNKKFSTKYNLRYHMESHSGVIKKCGQCDKEFKYDNDLRKHMKWHTNPKPFKCENCGRLFSRKFSYTRHMEICKPVGKCNEGIVTIEESCFPSKGGKEILKITQ